MLALLCPGQGSQTPGFLSPWTERSAVRDRLERLSAVAGVDLLAHGTTSDAETIRDTAVAQPLIVAAGLAVLPELLDGIDRAHDAHGADDAATGPDVVAGHSVGEITAAVVAGVLTEDDAITLVRERGRAMAEAAAVVPTGMSAVLGGDPDDVAAALERHGLTAANVNGAGQVVAAGPLDRLAALAQDPPTRSRVVPLQVAGAFHTAYMAPAVEALARCAADVTAADPRRRLLSNADGAVVGDGHEVLDRLVGQVSRPVRWDLCQATLADMGVTAVLELPPAGTLTGLARRALPGVETLALRTPDDLDAARDLVLRHAERTSAAQTSGARA